MKGYSMYCTSYNRVFGRVDWGSTETQEVVFHTPWPNMPTVTIYGGPYHLVVYKDRFTIDRVPDSPVLWSATELPGLKLDMEDIRRISEIYDTTPWWEGTVIPTGQYRLKEGQWRDGGPILQHLVTDPGGRRKRWITIPKVHAEAKDDV